MMQLIDYTRYEICSTLIVYSNIWNYIEIIMILTKCNFGSNTAVNEYGYYLLLFK